MERTSSFNFKLLVPPRVNYGQVSAVPPQGNVENGDVFMNKLSQGYTKCFDKEQSLSFSSTGLVAPTKPARQDFPKVKAVPPLEKDESNCNPGQLYSKLFDEVDKIKCWKAQVDNHSVQLERRQQENKRTIESQRKAIQELQFGNENLSIKLEEQIGENEDLRNKNNATRSLCNILKDTFQRSAEKIHLFESEREETHHLFMENTGSIQKLIAAFESLRIRAQADQQEMQKVKEDLLLLEEAKEKYHQDYNMKEKEVEVLQAKLRDKENEQQKILLDLHETLKHCKQLQEATDEQYKHLMSSKAEQESILRELHSVEQRCKETEKNSEYIAALLEESKEEYGKRIQIQDSNIEELSRVKHQQAEKLEQIQTTIQELQISLGLEMQRAKDLEDKLIANNKELEKRNTLFGETIEQSANKDEQIKILEEKLGEKSKSIDTLKAKIDVTEIRVEQLTSELSRKTQEAQLLKNKEEVVFAENDLLKMACGTAERAQEDLKEKSIVTEMKVQELKGQLFTERKNNKEYTFQMEQLRKDVTQHEVKHKELLSNFNELETEKMTIQQQLESGSSAVKAIEAKLKVSEEKTVILSREIQRLEDENQCLREAVNSIDTNIQGEYLKTETHQKEIEDNFDHLQEEVAEKEKQIKVLSKKLCILRKKFEMKLGALDEYQRENKVFQTQIAKEIARSSQLEDVINRLHEESENLKRLKEEEQMKLLKDLESKSTFAAELNTEVQKLRLTAAEAIKNKEDTELKCQHKIADMLTLMEKHKSQYDRMVEEKDAELDERKKKEMEAVAQRKSLELDLDKHKKDNDHLKQDLKIQVAEKERQQRELTDLKKGISSMKITQLSKITDKQSPASNYEPQRCSETPKESSVRSHMFDFSKTRKTPSYNKEDGIAAAKKKTEFDFESIRTSSGTTPKTKKIYKEDQKNKKITNRVGGTSKIRSYRIKTPPQEACWEKSNIEFDPRSDSSEQNDILSFTRAPAPNLSAPHCKLNILQKSPVNQKSPGNSLKLAAVKRMRDAGWTAVTGCDKKKKKNSEKIFA